MPYFLTATVLITLVGWLVFGTAVPNEFAYDDHLVLLPELMPLDFIFGPNNTWTIDLHYMPLTALYYNLLEGAFGPTPLPLHVAQIFLHIVTDVLLLRIFREFFNKGISLTLALIWLVHPLQVEAVAHMVAAGDILVVLVGLVALYLALPERLGYVRVMTIGVLLFASLLFKESGIVSIGIIVLYRVLFHRRRWWILAGVSLVVILAYLYIRLVLVQSYPSVFNGGAHVISNMPLTDRLLSIPAIMYYYIKQIFYPAHLAIFQIWVVDRIDWPRFWFPLCVDIAFFTGVAALGRFIFRRNRYALRTYLFFLLWFIGATLPYLHIVFPLDLTVADRFIYLALIGLLGVIGSFLQQALRLRSRRAAVLSVAAVVLLLCALSVRSIIRIGDWRTDTLIWSRDLYYDDIIDQVRMFSGPDKGKYAPVEERVFRNPSMGVSLVYPDTMKLSQITSELVSVANPALPGQDIESKLLIYSTKTQLEVTALVTAPFRVPGTLKQSKSVVFNEMQAVLNIYNDGSEDRHILLVKRGNRLVTIRFPRANAFPPGVMQKIVNSITLEEM